LLDQTTQSSKIEIDEHESPKEQVNAEQDEQCEQKRRLIAAAAEQREQDEQRDQENVELQRSLEQVNHSSKAKIKELEQELERANRSINALANDKALLERRFSKVYGKLHKICDKYCKYVRSHIINRIIIFN
jgi:chromosome segregation ATPase